MKVIYIYYDNNLIQKDIYLGAIILNKLITDSHKYNKYLNKVKKYPCSKCINCTKKDCGNCINCNDKPRFGGLGVRKKSCIYKKCLYI